MAADREPDEKGVTHVKTAELINGTFTPVPSNRESVVLSAKALHAATEEKVGARNSSSDASAIQQAHDLLTSLGAKCDMTGADDGEPKSAPAPEEKTTSPAEPEVPTDADAPEATPAESADESADTAAEAAEPTEESTDEKAMRDALLRINENAARLAFGG
jgi:hypothetical protein